MSSPWSLHFVPADANVDVITVEVKGSDVHYFLPRNLTAKHWPFGRAADHPQVRIKTRLLKRQNAGSYGRVKVVKAFEYLP